MMLHINQHSTSHTEPGGPRLKACALYASTHFRKYGKGIKGEQVKLAAKGVTLQIPQCTNNYSLAYYVTST